MPHRLILDAKRDEDGARARLYDVIRKDGRARMALYKSWRSAACMDFKDVEGEFWRGVMMGLPKVDVNVGDPIAHLVQRGVWQVKTAMREELQRKIVQQCITCGELNAQYSYTRTCKACDGTCENIYRHVSDDEITESQSYLDSVADVTLDVVRHHLTANMLRVLDALRQAFYTNPTNPVTEAARNLGVSRQRVHQLVSRIQAAVRHLTL